MTERYDQCRAELIAWASQRTGSFMTNDIPPMDHFDSWTRTCVLLDLIDAKVFCGDRPPEFERRTFTFENRHVELSAMHRRANAAKIAKLIELRLDLAEQRPDDYAELRTGAEGGFEIIDPDRPRVSASVHFHKIEKPGKGGGGIEPQGVCPTTD